MAVVGKPLLPVLDQQSTRELNLTVLQRMDRHVEDILTTAAHVTFYEFNVDLSQWSRKDVEGSLFVVKRRTQPRFQFVVMNRRSTENLVESLLGDFEYEVQVPYLLYRNAAQEVNGIWFYNPRECEDVAKLFQRILNAFSKIPPKPKLFAPSSEFQELEAVPTAATVEGPLEPGATATSSAPEDGTDEPLERFFTSAVHIHPPDVPGPVASHPSVPAHPSVVSVSSSPPLIPLLLPGPPLSTTTLPPPLLVPPLSLDTPDVANAQRTTLIKPSFFVPPLLISASNPPLAAPPPPLQPSHGAPFLQPFPPPAPPPSLAPATSLLVNTPITREGVRDALFRLLQNEHFIDMVYREIVKAHP